MAYEPKKGEVAGFDLVGHRQADGSIILGTPPTSESIPEFPEEVKAFGAVYTLEYIKKNDPDDKLPNEHSGKTIEWGIYV
jgi:hypothetical protein